jgi:putative restriction endonuclease
MKNGGAPHKPILLLSVICLFEKGIFTDNRIFVLPELVASFKSNWAKLVVTNHLPIFTLPFYHLCSEPFWKLIANTGCEKLIESESSMRRFENLITAVNYALIDNELVDLLLVPENRDILKTTLLDKYFSSTKSNFGTGGDDDLLSEKLLYDNSETCK